MRLVRQQQVSLEWTDIRNRVQHPYPEDQDRKPGYHVSGILRAVALRSNHLAKKYSVQDPDNMAICIAMGFAWESWVVGLYPDMIWQPGSKCVDNIYGSIDGLTITDSDYVVEEFKYTLKSKNSHPILTQWLWVSQAKSYCYMYHTQLARFHVLWGAGSYRPPTPEYHTYLIEFTQEELEENWDILLRNKHLAVPE